MTQTTTPNFTLGDRLRKAREYADVSSAAMAEALNVSRNTVTNYEHERTPITVAALVVYADVTGVPVSWLIGGDDPDLRSRCFSAAVDQLELFANTYALTNV
jgi:transcriptional regulator with XRE-family HTH domain